MARSLLLRGLAVVYFIAFVSFIPQIDGLIGSNGILPIQKYLEGIHAEYGTRAYFYLPTLVWLNPSDLFLHVLTWAGVLASIALFVGVLPLSALIALFVLYLSIDTAGQAFFSFQWDSLLLEAGFAAILLAPPGFRPAYTDPPRRMAIWLFRFLIFRLMLESGIVKLLSGDPTWRNLTALNYHYETQPLPTPPAWYFAHFPQFVQKVSVASMFVIELAIPFLFLAPRKLRRVGAGVTIAFQLLIAFTGNYTFFNFLTIALCFIPLFDSGERALPGRFRWVICTVSGILIALGLLQLVNTLGLIRMPEPLATIDFAAETFHIVNRYGLFAVMTTSRSEIVIEGSNDGDNWQPYEFRYKPGDVKRRLPWVAPYQPRLDWQMWFAALSNYQDNPWFSQFMLRLLQGTPEVTGLLATNPFPGKPPRLIRAAIYDYHFSDRAARRETGAVWTRQYLGQYFPTVSLR